MFMRAVHPGLVRKDELETFGIAPTAFARQIDVPPNRVSQIIAGKRAITGDTALRLGHWFGTEPQFWLNLQTQFDLVVARKSAGAVIRHLPTKAGPGGGWRSVEGGVMTWANGPAVATRDTAPFQSAA
jgi:addiction module HigA family antidote